MKYNVIIGNQAYIKKYKKVNIHIKKIKERGQIVSLITDSYLGVNAKFIILSHSVQPYTIILKVVGHFCFSAMGVVKHLENTQCTPDVLRQ